MKAKVKVKLDAGAVMPRYAHSTDVGADVVALRTWLVQGDGMEHELRTMTDCLAMQAMQIDCAKVKIDTGVHVQPEEGYYVELVPNSRIAKSPFMFANSIGIIDPEYTGSMRVILNTINRLTPDDLAQFLPGQVVGQLIIREQISGDFEQVDDLTETARGSGGFGSTAKLPLETWHPLPAENGQQSNLTPIAEQQQKDLFTANGN